MNEKVYLSDLIRELNTIKDVDWIRIHYAHPAYLSQKIIDAIAESDKVCNYLDMPIQHAADDILKSMRRDSSQKTIRNRISRLRNAVSEIAIRTTLIVGYPGETEEHFECLKSFIEEIKFDRLGIFTYSEEEGTAAAALEDNVPRKLKDERKNSLQDIQQDISLEKTSCSLVKN